ncbi:hypothetical protein GPECTOR_50g660 [Gonium pectorale]|uniref:MaoC-like domain-containing protein n=1 Tax=Gonium pectorale TaxID=33097 RepID=A0A150G7M5_GONPE|nr:hypothetical protein GPECTOR_50g660 [Gonium pectorale]|eukprot:KXZ45866.1 hypothetical protein GPECTOR_50g660 [Gonium pectorale]
MWTWAALATAALALAPVVALLLRPHGYTLVLSGWPHPLWLYLQAFAAVAKLAGKSSSAKKGAAKAIQASLARPVHFSGTRLRRYLALAGFSGGTAGQVPLMYPIVESFRLFMQCMLTPVFPFNVMGSVLAGTRVVALRAVGAEEKLIYSCRVDPAFRTTAKGDTEVDIAVEAHAAAPPSASSGGAGGSPSPSSSSLVWRSVTTVIILSPRRSKGGPRQEPAGPAKAAAEPPAPEATKVVDTWRLGPDTGRRYGLLNGDLNPIHLWPATSRLFGFKRPIAHALYLTGRAEASLRNAGLELQYPCVLSAEFKRPTLLPATLHCAWRGALAVEGGATDPRVALSSVEGARFAVLTEDRAKEVLTGSISAAPEAVKAATA